LTVTDQTGCDGRYTSVKLVAALQNLCQGIDRKPGDVQHFEFGVTNGTTVPLPPWYEQDAPRDDTTINGKVKQGFEGKPKGVRQVLFERGWWDPAKSMRMSMPKAKILANGTVQPLPPVDTIGSLVLAELDDFANEKSEMEKVIIERGHILTMSPKCHPELAGAQCVESVNVANLTR
jgi:hypothetical protein